MQWHVVILVLCASFVGKSAAQLRCYACSYTTDSSDQSCLTITENTLSVDCPYRYCTIIRQEFLDPAGVISSFLRGCDDEPDHLNHEITDTTFRTFYRACTNDLCNTGNGIQSIVGGGLSPTPEYTGRNLLVPGTGGAADINGSLLPIVMTVIVNLMLYR